jgi:hypothetical protein
MKALQLIILPAVLALLASAQKLSDAEFREGMKENLFARIHESDVVATICVYEQEWIPPTKQSWKGELWERAVVTDVHKGDFRVGAQLEYFYLIEDSPNLFERFRSTVPGKLKYFFFSTKDMKSESNRLRIGVGSHWSCERLSGIFAELFQEELARNPSLILKSEQTTEAD